MLAALGLVMLLPFPASAALTAWFQFGSFLGVAVGAGVYRVALVLTPLRPQSRFNQSAQPRQPSAAAGLQRWASRASLLP